MNKVTGLRTDFAPVREDGSRIIISYGLTEIENNLCEWYELYFYKKQHAQVSTADIKAAIIADINAHTDAKILSGFVWEGKSVWLSEENQRNFSEAQRVAAMHPEAILPVTFKLGEDAEGRAVYHEFRSAEELTDFYLSIVGYIQQCLADGWAVKDSMDFTPYEPIATE